MAKSEEVISIIGTAKEEISRKEIIMALESLKQKVISNSYDQNKEKWNILAQKV